MTAPVDQMLYGGDNLDKARKIFAVDHPAAASVLEKWPVELQRPS